LAFSGIYMPEDAAVRHEPDEPCGIKAIMVIADLGWSGRVIGRNPRDVRSATRPEA
jgi:hypothetical protein